MTDAELHQGIVERDRAENIAIAANGPATFRAGITLAGSAAVALSSEVAERDGDNFDGIEVVSTEEGER